MSTGSRATKACVGLGAVLALLFGAMAGCSSSDEKGSGDADAGLVCPGSLADIGKACIVEGKVCATGYACGSFNQQAVCTCSGGHFACTDVAGTDLAPGQAPACVPNGTGHAGECPSSETQADLATCKTPGLQCFYLGLVCPENNGNPNRDVCECSVPPDGGALVFHCDRPVCNPRGDASADAYQPPPPPDASDANVDAPADAREDG